MGDVLRTTTLLRALKERFPKAEIWWLTKFPEVVTKEVDVILPFNSEGVLPVLVTDFHIAYNLDKDKEACALMNKVKALKKRGFCLRDGRTAPIDRLAQAKFETGLSDDISKANKKSYQEEIFEMCGFIFLGEEYIIDAPDDFLVISDKRRALIGLNTGCGLRWSTRLWKDEYWIELSKLLLAKDYRVLLLGGEEEHEKNIVISEQGGGRYIGYFSYKNFVAEVNQCDLVVSAFTMAMHVAIGLRKKVVGLNSIFNSGEIELYGRGKIVEPVRPCECYFQSECTNKEYYCMDTLKPERVLQAIEELI